MKKIVLTSLGAILLATAANAGAYVAGHVATIQDEGVAPFKSAMLTGTVGWAFQNGIRLEADLLSLNLWDGNDETDINFTLVAGSITEGATASMFKVLYDFKLDGPVTPYVGAGINPFVLSYWYNSDSEGSLSNLHILGTAIIGVSYAMNDKISLDLQYNRVFNYSWERQAFGGSTYTESRSSGYDLIKLGARYNF